MFARIKPIPFYKSYANLSSARVATTDDPSGKGRHAIGFSAGGAGTLVLRPRSGAADGSNDVSVTATAGMERFLEFDQITSGTATVVTVYWER